MERLTKLRERGDRYVSAIGSGHGCWGQIIARLAAYEDTGLEPEEIVKMGMMFEDSKRYSGRLEAKLKRYQDAESEGLMVILPCKIGTTLYRIVESPTTPRYCGTTQIRAVEFNKHNFWRVVFGGEFGKTVFLTREEAEEAMKKEEV